jgi:hypothetical protein
MARLACLEEYRDKIMAYYGIYSILGETVTYENQNHGAPKEPPKRFLRFYQALEVKHV